MERVRGFTLVEIMMVVVLIGVIAAAAFVFLRGGTSAAESVTSCSVEASAVRMAASRMESILSNAGYMGEVFPGAWEPVIAAEVNRFTFIANLTDPQSFGPEDTLTILSENGTITIADASGDQFMAPIPGEAAFQYFDAAGTEVTEPVMVRRIEYTFISEQGTEFTSSVSPRNLAAAHDSEMLLALFEAYKEEDQRAIETVFYDSFEFIPGYAFYDEMEASNMWVPFIVEDFEDYVQFNDNWIRMADYGYSGRGTGGAAYEGDYFLYLANYAGNPTGTQTAIWEVDLSEYDYSTPLNLNFWWARGSNVPYPDDTGLFLPVWVEDEVVVILDEDFSEFRGDGFPRGWTYWTNDYGRVEVSSAYPVNGNYLNLDTRRQGYTGTSRVMATMDLSPYAADDNITLSFNMCSRGSPNSAFVGLIGSGGISSDPVAQQNLFPGSYPAGTWTSIEIDLKDMIPAGYDLSNTKLVFGQSGTGMTIGMSNNGGVSFDNVSVSSGTDGYWDMSRKIDTPAPSYATWTERDVDLNYWAQYHGVPFSDTFYIGFQHRGNNPAWTEGLVVDLVSIQEPGWGMEGWTSGTWPGYTLCEWEPSQHAVFPSSPGVSWCFATAGSGNYQNQTTHAWLQSPEIDLTSWSPGQRIAVSFQHYYNFGTNSGNGGNVKISSDDGATWNLAIPYWGYYTASVPALGGGSGEPGWNLASPDWSDQNWQFSVIDISEYAGERIRLRFNYGIQQHSTHPPNIGWNIDMTRSRLGADWPQIRWSGQPDWQGWGWSDGFWDPSTAPSGEGSRWVGNDISGGGWIGGVLWDYRYHTNQENALVSPPIFFDSSSGNDFAYVEFFDSARFETDFDRGYFEVSAFSETANPWHSVFEIDGVWSDWYLNRFRIDPLFDAIGADNRTVVFRWRMTSDGSINEGGWNVDGIHCYTSDQLREDILRGQHIPIGESLPEALIIQDNTVSYATESQIDQIYRDITKSDDSVPEIAMMLIGEIMRGGQSPLYDSSPSVQDGLEVVSVGEMMSPPDVPAYALPGESFPNVPIDVHATLTPVDEDVFTGERR